MELAFKLNRTSDGQAVTDASEIDITIDGVKKHLDEVVKSSGGGAMVSTTYSALKALRDAGNLVEGTQYRITDYHCTTTQEDTQSADHQFDIIVTADSKTTLSEIARACLHTGDTYFSGFGANLSAWELKYCLDNDTDRFVWADEENGKGVVYFMKDEWNNECPYDFKNIQFKRIISWDEDNSYWIVDEGEEMYLYTLSAYDIENSEWKDASMCNGLAPDDVCWSCQNNNIKEYSFDYDSGAKSCCLRLNNIVFMNVFSEDDCLYFYCNYNTFGNNCNSNTFGNRCYSNTFGNNCSSNTFGNNCYYNTFGNYCSSNTFGSDCNNNTFGNGCYANTFENECYYNTFGNYCIFNTFGNICYYNTFGNNCNYNTFGNNCNSNTFGNRCYSNTFGNNCYYNTFGNYCHANTFGNNCNSNTFGNGCKFNTFGNSSSTRSYFNTITLESGCAFLYIDCSATTSSSMCCQNVHVNSGVAGTSSSRKTLTVETAGNAFLTTFGNANDTKINV